MKRRILTYGGYFEAFMSSLKEKEQEKYNTDFSCSRLRTGFPRSSSNISEMVYMSCAPNTVETSFVCFLYSTKVK